MILTALLSSVEGQIIGKKVEHGPHNHARVKGEAKAQGVGKQWGLCELGEIECARRTGGMCAATTTVVPYKRTPGFC